MCYYSIDLTVKLFPAFQISLICIYYNVGAKGKGRYLVRDRKTVRIRTIVSKLGVKEFVVTRSPAGVKVCVGCTSLWV